MVETGFEIPTIVKKLNIGGRIRREELETKASITVFTALHST
jgi:hypothetical protein